MVKLNSIFISRTVAMDPRKIEKQIERNRSDSDETLRLEEEAEDRAHLIELLKPKPN